MNQIHYLYLYLLSPLHTGGTTQEGNLVGIARESHTNLPYIPSSTIRGRLRASVNDEALRVQLFGPELTDIKSPTASETSPNLSPESSQLEQGDIWLGDASLLWLPVSSLSHGVVWISSPMLLRRWARFVADLSTIPNPYSTNLVSETTENPRPIYLKDAIIKDSLQPWSNWQAFVPQAGNQSEIQRVLLLPDQHCSTLIQMSLWRQVKIKLDAHKSVEGGFRYEEAIPPDTLMYVPWGVTSQVNSKATTKRGQELANRRQGLAEGYGMSSTENGVDLARGLFELLLDEEERNILQIGGQESLGRGFVQQFR
ncbi:type III-B CRISPR module RAMP protein Cmr4 [Coleofasciculus sp. G2-EDA-02]|uniref:type III-B CRISPR module RAMP protein Cmr4 n=1 Tax=Coleofasciculus sp. G2-EDA-02 TaxID=3069529 RepID=UPI0032FBE6B9